MEEALVTDISSCFTVATSNGNTTYTPKNVLGKTCQSFLNNKEMNLFLQLVSPLDAMPAILPGSIKLGIQSKQVQVRLLCPPIHKHIITRRYFFSRVHATLQPALSVSRSVCRILLFLFLWPHWSRPNGLVTLNTTPAYQHATSVAVYPALFFLKGVNTVFADDKRLFITEVSNVKPTLRIKARLL